jgi:hypothetical protein
MKHAPGGALLSKGLRPAGVAVRLGWLLHPAFIAALVLLVVNDHVLKAQFGNALTGKLSDFAGLFALAYFLSAMAGRGARAIHAAVALAFVVWKSPWSQPLIDAWNSLALMQVGRVVDATDAMALAILPLSLWALSAAAMGAKQRTAPTWQRLGVATIALVAFTATSRVSMREVHADYLSPVPAPALVTTIVAGGHEASGAADELSLPFENAGCISVWADFRVRAAGDMTMLSLRSFQATGCDLEQQELAELFRAVQPQLQALQARLLRPYRFPAPDPKKCPPAQGNVAGAMPADG